jgi:hypothetical protein
VGGEEEDGHVRRRTGGEDDGRRKTKVQVTRFPYHPMGRAIGGPYMKRGNYVSTPVSKSNCTFTHHFSTLLFYPSDFKMKTSVAPDFNTGTLSQIFRFFKK